MPPVVSNTSPLLYLHLLDSLPVLQALYGAVFVPEAVRDELDAGRRSGISTPDLRTIEWIRVEEAPPTASAALAVDLDPGEAAAIALALEKADPLVILDDKVARSYAAVLGLRVTGTLGVFLAAKRIGLVATVAPLLDALDTHGFRMGDDLRRGVLRAAGEG